MFTRK
jgi:hypothetical protein